MTTSTQANVPRGLRTWPKTRVSELLGVEYPIILAPMNQAITNELMGTPQLVAAVSNAGGLGIFGAGILSPDELRSNIRQIKALTKKPFGVNLLVPYERDARDMVGMDEKIFNIKQLLGKIDLANGNDNDFDVRHAHAPTKRACRDNNGKGVVRYMDAQPTLAERPNKRMKRDYDTPMFPHYHEHLDVCIEEKVTVVQFAFGLPTFDVVYKCQMNGITTMGTCTSLEEALLLQKSGVNMLVVQGSEAGGQRAVFLSKNLEETDRQGTFVLVPQLSRAITTIPIVASGGIMDARGVVACLALGAEGVMMGTAFMKSNECATSSAYKQVMDEGVTTLITRSFTGRPVRAIANSYVKLLEKEKHMIPVFPIQHNLVVDTMRQAVKQGTYYTMNEA